jgi:hypothetical protein
MRHISLDLTLTDLEATMLLAQLTTMPDYLPHAKPLKKMGEALYQAMMEQPQNILFFTHDTDEVVKQRKICDFCEGDGLMDGDDTCCECDGTGKVE